MRFPTSQQWGEVFSFLILLVIFSALTIGGFRLLVWLATR